MLFDDKNAKWSLDTHRLIDDEQKPFSLIAFQFQTHRFRIYIQHLCHRARAMEIIYYAPLGINFQFPTEKRKKFQVTWPETKDLTVSIRKSGEWITYLFLHNIMFILSYHQMLLYGVFQGKIRKNITFGQAIFRLTS